MSGTRAQFESATFPDLTVKENLFYAAELRLPPVRTHALTHARSCHRSRTPRLPHMCDDACALACAQTMTPEERWQRVEEVICALHLNAVRVSRIARVLLSAAGL
jgi:hypothetical protein